MSSLIGANEFLDWSNAPASTATQTNDDEAVSTTTAAGFQGGDQRVNGYWIGPEADLRGANLIGANLRGAVADEDTFWPERFDPKAAGVIFD